MPSGIVHYKHFLKGYRYSTPISIVSSFWDWKFGLGYFIGYSIHRWIDNDWDIFGSNNAEGRLVNEIPFLGHIIYGVSSSYGSVFRRHHRSWMTHLPVVSTLIRLVWVLAIPFAFLDSYGINFVGNGWVNFWLGVWAGLSHADGIHWHLDKHYQD